MWLLCIVLFGSIKETGPGDCGGKSEIPWVLQFSSKTVLSWLYYTYVMTCRYTSLHPLCGLYSPTGCHTPHIGDKRTDVITQSTNISAWPCELHRNYPVLLLNHVCICVHYTMPTCSPLAMAIWSAGSLPGVDCADSFSPKVASHWNLHHCVLDDHEILSKGGSPGSISGDCLCPAILHAILWTW